MFPSVITPSTSKKMALIRWARAFDMKTFNHRGRGLLSSRRNFGENCYNEHSMSAALIPATLAWAHPLVQEWFVSKFGTPTEPQEQGWPHIIAGRTTLISAPTGSGK